MRKYNLRPRVSQVPFVSNDYSDKKETQKVPHETQKVPHETQKVPQETQKVPQETQKVQQDDIVDHVYVSLAHDSSDEEDVKIVQEITAHEQTLYRLNTNKVYGYGMGYVNDIVLSSNYPTLLFENCIYITKSPTGWMSVDTTGMISAHWALKEPNIPGAYGPTGCKATFDSQGNIQFSNASCIIL